MTAENLDLITRITVEIHRNNSFKDKLGTGVLYSNKCLTGKVYVLTAGHCLSELDKNEHLSLRYYNPLTGVYEYFTPNTQTIIHHTSPDVGIIILNLSELSSMIQNPQSVYVMDSHLDYNDAVTKGFPIANLDQKSEYGESSLSTLLLSYLQEQPVQKVFNLSTLDDYNESTIKGMSGSGIFIEASGELYLCGIFTRFTDEEKGKVVEAQKIAPFNELLRGEYMKEIPLSYLGYSGLGHKTFENNVRQAIANLGPRYCQKVNVKTGTAKHFECVAKTQDFYRRMRMVIDGWITEKRYDVRESSPRIGKLESLLRNIRSDFASALKEFKEGIDSYVDFTNLMKRLDDFLDKAHEVQHRLFDEMRLVRGQSEKNELIADRNRLSDIILDLSNFISDYNELKISLAKDPYLIIKGQAGSGKSHMFGDVAQSRLNRGLPTLLFLGTDFAEESYETTILSKIGFCGTFPELLAGLNQIGMQVGSRTLLMIDALNEGKRAELWKYNLNGLIQALKDYPAIGLAVSVRDTYLYDIIPENIENVSNVTIIEHTGFKGLEYEAVRQYCIEYGLTLPNVPILTPEFCNPLFLKIICDTLEALGEKDFPQGFNGISSLFNKYFKILDCQFENKRIEYKYKRVVSSSIQSLAGAILTAPNGMLAMEEAERILRVDFPACNCLLADLIDNNVLLKRKASYTDEMDYVEFAFQRVGDFIMAEKLVEKYTTWECFAKHIRTDKALRAIFIDGLWSLRGVIEALAILIPEKYSHEIAEVKDYIPKRHLRRFLNGVYEEIKENVVESLKWRSIDSISVETIRCFFRSNLYPTEQWYYKLVEFSTIQNHPFNADFFHKMMMRKTMSERDGEFQFFFNGCAGYNDYKNANPLRILIDWAWTEGISEKAEQETARLAAIMLCWLLSSTYIKHRDEATKALVNLLTEKIDVLIAIMRLFENVDDMYITERIYAVAYGVVLRTSSTESLTNLSKYVYDTIFKLRNPPKHVLLRDYARNIIEYTYYKVGHTSFDMKKVRPPYASPLPEWPSDNDVKQFYVDYDSPDYEKKKGYEQNLIWFSVKDGLADFWNKMASPIIGKFYPLSFAEEQANDDAEGLFKGKLKTIAKQYADNKALGRNDYIGAIDDVLMTLFSPEQLKAVNDVMIPYRRKQLQLNSSYLIEFPKEGARNWLVKRAYELGFDVERHGNYDRFAKDWRGERIERIGKKYQWIAFYELMGILADNYRFKDDYSNERDKYESLKGTWQSYLRDINPSLILRENSKENSEVEDEFAVSDNVPWYMNETFDNWVHTDSYDIWTSMLKDLPDPVSFILKSDNDGHEWFTLNNSRTWYESKEFGENKYERRGEQGYLSVYVDAILVRSEDLERTATFFENRILWNAIELPRDDWQHLINREKFWSPAYRDVYRENDDWHNDITGLDVSFMYSCEQACGHIENDCSGTLDRYSIPCRRIFEGMGMKYHTRDGQYVDQNGDIVAIAYGYDQILIKKAPFIKFLKQNDLAIIWLVRGEKRIFSYGTGCLCEHNPCGVYRLDDNDIPKGVLKSYKRF